MARKKMLTAEETAYFCEQAATVLKAGIPLQDGLAILAEDMENTRMRNVLNEIIGVLEDEKPIFKALEVTAVFPSYAVKMIEIGTLTGRLEAVLTALSEYYEQQSELRGAIKSAVMHPLMLLVMMAAVIIVLVLKVIPMFKSIFDRFDESAGIIVEKSISTAYSLGITLLIIMFAIILIIGVFALLANIPSMKKKLNTLFSNFFLTKNLLTSISLTHFSNAMSMMTASGIDTVESLEYAEKLITNKKLKSKISTCRENVLEGKSFADALHEVKIFPAMQAHSLKIAYQSGTFDTAWKKIGNFYDEQTNRTLNNLVTFIEPLLIGVLAVVIGAVLLTIMVPLMDIMSSLG